MVGSIEIYGSPHKDRREFNSGNAKYELEKAKATQLKIFKGPPFVVETSRHVSMAVEQNRISLDGGPRTNYQQRIHYQSSEDFDRDFLETDGQSYKMHE